MENCKACKLCRTRRKVVEPRIVGAPSSEKSVLFVGDVPTRMDETLGKACSAQDILGILSQLMTECEVGSFGCTNMMKCRVADSLQGDHRDPTHEELLACRPQLFEFIEQYAPGKIVLMGNLTHRFLASEFKGAVLIPHPAAISKAGGVGSGLYRNVSRKLKEALNGYAFTF